MSEYCEGFPVEIIETDGGYDECNKLFGVGRLAIRAANEGGFDCTEVDLIELIEWVKKNMPELL